MVRLAVIEELELPSRLVRLRSQTARERRSKSQPIHSPIHIDSDDEYDPTAEHISRMDALGFYNVSSESDGCSSKTRSFRSSVHSTTSSMASSSTASSNEEQEVLTAEAAWDHVAILPDELPFAAGDIINVIDCTSHSDLWFGGCRDRTGWFSSSHVRLLERNTSNRNSFAGDFPQPMRYLRAKIIQELMSTERDYVTLLQNLVQGFLEQTRRRTEMFPPSRIQRIFGNLEAICTLHCKFLRELEMTLDPKIPENSCIGNVFLQNVLDAFNFQLLKFKLSYEVVNETRRSSFSIYSEYCNNRPVSCTELAFLEEQPHYHQFFEACRLLRGMPKLTLEGFLLTPVQRICRYPLQLAELLKATPSSHNDREPVQAAACAMKNVAALINEKKRRLEGLQKIALWQKNVDGWRGPDLVESNSHLIYNGEVTCRCVIVGNTVWQKDVQLFLFDQCLVICKKDLIKKNHYIFRDRVPMALATFVDCKDGKDPSLNITLKNAWKLVLTGKEFYFSCRDRETKKRWTENFRRRIVSCPPTSEERRLVRDTLSRTYQGKTESSCIISDSKSNGRFSRKKNRK
uniref:DH domain-containing protein n=1 Tax=Syphacia muris TaxID=451379 RepID=A0A0N5AIJ6_9BILA